MGACLVLQVEAKVGFGEDVYVCGDTPSLGNFDPKHAVQLFATTRSYPIWESPVVSLPKGAVVQYKYALFCGGEFSAWEKVRHPRHLRADALADSAAAVSTAFGGLGRGGDHGSGSDPSDLDDLGAQDAATTTSSDVLHVTPEDPPPDSRTAAAAAPDAQAGGAPYHAQSRFGDWTNEVTPPFLILGHPFTLSSLVSCALVTCTSLSISLSLSLSSLSLSLCARRGTPRRARPFPRRWA
jgi:hypothetical protein